jgi:hypothetical protein
MPRKSRKMGTPKREEARLNRALLASSRAKTARTLAIANGSGRGAVRSIGGS